MAQEKSLQDVGVALPFFGFWHRGSSSKQETIAAAWCYTLSLGRNHKPWGYW